MDRTRAERKGRRTGRRAFSLVEILIVITILAIIAVMTAPMFRSGDVDLLRAAARVLAADLEYARVDSMTHGQDPRLVVIDAAADGYYLAASSDPDTPITNPADRTPYRRVFGRGALRGLGAVAVGAVSLDGDDRVGFGRYGQLDQIDQAVITLSAGSHQVSITIDPVTGDVTVGSI